MVCKHLVELRSLVQHRFAGLCGFNDVQSKNIRTTFQCNSPYLLYVLSQTEGLEVRSGLSACVRLYVRKL